MVRICKGRRENSEYYKEQQALSEWAKLTGTQAMTLDLLRFFVDEVALYPEEEVGSWADTLTELFNYELQAAFHSLAFILAAFATRNSRLGTPRNRCWLA